MISWQIKNAVLVMTLGSNRICKMKGLASVLSPVEMAEVSDLRTIILVFIKL